MSTKIELEHRKIAKIVEEYSQKLIEYLPCLPELFKHNTDVDGVQKINVQIHGEILRKIVENISRTEYSIVFSTKEFVDEFIVGGKYNVHINAKNIGVNEFIEFLKVVVVNGGCVEYQNDPTNQSNYGTSSGCGRLNCTNCRK